MACTIGLVHSHRFAFYFWAKFNEEYSKKNLSLTHNKPILVSIDFHNDSGVESDFNKEEIKEINISDDVELGLYCWLRLHALNDGHILPALYLEFFSDVYILLKQNLDIRESRQILDKNSNEHLVKYFKTSDKLVEELRKARNHPIFLDIDLDYFVIKDDANIMGAGNLVPMQEIRDILGLKTPLLKTIYQNLVGLTVALEPEYCGGMNNALQALKILNEEFFCGSLFTDKCKWNA